MKIRTTLTFLLVLIAAILSAGPVRDAHGQTMGNFIESYTARLSPRDHYNSNGVRLTSAAAIIRQDRANFYVYGMRDSEDEPDSFFSDKSNRARLEQMLENGRATRDDQRDRVGRVNDLSGFTGSTGNLRRYRPNSINSRSKRRSMFSRLAAPSTGDLSPDLKVSLNTIHELLAIGREHLKSRLAASC